MVLLGGLAGGALEMSGGLFFMTSVADFLGELLEVRVFFASGDLARLLESADC